MHNTVVVPVQRFIYHKYMYQIGHTQHQFYQCG